MTNARSEDSLFSNSIVYSSLATTFSGFLASMAMDYQSNPSLSHIFAKYLLPVAGASVLGGVLGGDPAYHPENFKELGISKKWAAAAALSMATIVGGIGLVQKDVQRIDLNQKVLADRIASAPVIAPETIVPTTAQKAACGNWNHGRTLYVDPNGNEFQVSCLPTPK